MSNSLTRKRIVSAVRTAVEPLPLVLAMWEGGSAAWKRDDEWSDIDLQLLVVDDHAAPTVDAVDSALGALSDIERRYEVPKPTRHGHDQVFYRLADAGEFLLVDLAFMNQSNPSQLSERQRHGERIVLFDKTGAAGPTDLDSRSRRTYRDSYLANLRTVFAMFQSLTKKELRRGNEVAALAFYHTHTLQPLVTLLRMRHCPERFDFGPKYAKVDLPPPVYLEIRDLFFVANPDELGEKQKRAEAVFSRTLREIDST